MRIIKEKQIEESSYWSPSTHLRYKWKEVITPIAEHFSVTTNEKVLQQEWLSNAGKSEWRDIEIVK